jgi:hypothetical protein
MSETATALPPHVEEPKGFDVAADVAALKSAPKQDYSEQWKQTEEPKKPEPAASGAGATPEGEPPPAPGNQESAKEFIEAYDTVQSYSFSIYSEGLKPEKFQLPEFAKTRAAHHLAKGLEAMGSPELPWWLGLLIALAPPSFTNYMTAKAYRQSAEEAAARNAEQAKRGQPVHPTSITRRDGTVVPMSPPPPPSEPVTFQEPTVAAQSPAAPRKQNPNMPLCQECGIVHVASKKRKYCSKSCAGKATSKKNREKSAQ